MRLADIVTQYATALIEQYGHELLPSQRKALSAFQLCRCAQDAVVLRQLRRIKLVSSFMRQPALSAVPG